MPKTARAIGAEKFAAEPRTKNLEGDIMNFLDAIHEFIVDGEWDGTEDDIAEAILEQFPNHEVYVGIVGTSCYASAAGPTIDISVDVDSADDNILLDTFDAE